MHTKVDLAIFLASGFSGVEGLGLGFTLSIFFAPGRQ